MASYWHILLFSLIGGLFSLIGGAFLLARRKSAEVLARYVTPFAAGALLAAVFLDLLSEGVEQGVAGTVFLAALLGIILFFFGERFLHWFHHHHDHEDKKTDPRATLVIVGDIVHNALDGIAIAAAFLVSVPTGIITTIAVAAHEIPQEIGDFGLLLNKGLSRRQVLVINVLSALSTTATALLTFWFGSETALPLGFLLGLSAGFLLYIAMSDIIPTIHEEIGPQKLLDIRPFLLILGAVVVALSINLAHRYTEPVHQEEKSTATTLLVQQVNS